MVTAGAGGLMTERMRHLRPDSDHNCDFARATQSLLSSAETSAEQLSRWFENGVLQHYNGSLRGRLRAARYWQQGRKVEAVTLASRLPFNEPQKDASAVTQPRSEATKWLQGMTADELQKLFNLKH